MSTSTIRILTCAACVSAGAFFVAWYTLEPADNLEREAACIPPRGMIVPETPPPVSEQPRTKKLGGNPFNWEDGRLVPKDPMMKQTAERAEGYYRISRVSRVVAWVVPVLAMILIVLRMRATAHMKRLMAEIALAAANDPKLHCASNDPANAAPRPTAPHAAEPLMSRLDDQRPAVQASRPLV